MQGYPATAGGLYSRDASPRGSVPANHGSFGVCALGHLDVQKGWSFRIDLWDSLPMRRFVYIAIVLALVGIVVLIANRPMDDGLDRYPHTFLKEAGYDPAAVEILIGPLSTPPPPPEGLKPAWICDDPAFADKQGRPWLFPMVAGGTSEPVPPVNPALRKRPALASCRLYMTPEGAAQVEAFRAKVVK